MSFCAPPWMAGGPPRYDPYFRDETLDRAILDVTTDSERRLVAGYNWWSHRMPSEGEIVRQFQMLDRIRARYRQIVEGR